MTEKILILGGTREASELATKLVEQGHDVTTSLAGRTREPKPLDGSVRVGGFGGAEKLAEYIAQQGFTQLIDATHPFAGQISKNAKRAAGITGIPIEVITRPPWKMIDGDQWIKVSSLEKARETIPAGSRVLLALGSQHIGLFADRSDVFFLVRMVDQPEKELPLANFQLVLGTPSIDPDEEVALLQHHAITHIVCRNSGGRGAYAKIEAARNLRLPVIIVERPNAA